MQNKAPKKRKNRKSLESDPCIWEASGGLIMPSGAVLSPLGQNRNIAVSLRFRLFDAVVSPCALYSLSTTPLTVQQLGKLDVVQRTMLRRVVGWVRVDGESWEITGSRMKRRLEAALTQHPIKDWSSKRNEHRDVLKHKVISGSLSVLCSLSFRWRPTVRRRGRPHQRWTD